MFAYGWGESAIVLIIRKIKGAIDLVLAGKPNWLTASSKGYEASDCPENVEFPLSWGGVGFELSADKNSFISQGLAPVQFATPKTRRPLIPPKRRVSVGDFKIGKNERKAGEWPRGDKPYQHRRQFAALSYCSAKPNALVSGDSFL